METTTGWIKLHRKFLQSSIFESRDPYLIQLFQYCLMTANWENKKVIIGNEIVYLKRGQFITGRKTLVKDLTNCRHENSKLFKKFESLYRRKLFLLQKNGSLTIKSTNKFTIVTIQNYDSYQTNDQQMTNKRPTDDQQMTTTKNIKNIKNNKEYTPSIISPKKYSTLKDINQDVIDEVAEGYKVPAIFVSMQFEALRNYCESKGHVYKNYKAALKNFVLKEMTRMVENQKNQKGGVYDASNL